MKNGILSKEKINLYESPRSEEIIFVEQELLCTSGDPTETVIEIEGEW